MSLLGVRARARKQRLETALLDAVERLLVAEAEKKGPGTLLAPPLAELFGERQMTTLAVAGGLGQARSRTSKHAPLSCAAGRAHVDVGQRQQGRPFVTSPCWLGHAHKDSLRHVHSRPAST